jgi:hypothetical protein
MGINVSKELVASIFKAEQTLEDREDRFLGNIRISLPYYTVAYPTLKMETPSSFETLTTIYESNWCYTRFSTLKMETTRLHIPE